MFEFAPVGAPCAARVDYSALGGLPLDASAAQLREWARAHADFLGPFGLGPDELARAKICAPHAALARARVRVGECALGSPEVWPAPQELRPEQVAAFSWDARALWLVAVCDADEHACVAAAAEVSLLPLCRETVTRLSKHWCARASGPHWAALRPSSRAALAAAVEAHAPEVDRALRMLWDCKLSDGEEEGGSQEPPEAAQGAGASSSRATQLADTPPLGPVRAEGPPPLSLGPSLQSSQGFASLQATLGAPEPRHGITQARKRQADEEADAVFVSALWETRGAALNKLDRFRLSRLLDAQRARDLATAERGSMLAIRSAAQERLHVALGARGASSRLEDAENAETEVVFATYQPMSELASGSSTAIKKATPLIRPLIARQLLRAYEAALECGDSQPEQTNSEACANSVARATDRAAVLLLDELVRGQARPLGDVQNALVDMCGRLWEKQFLQCAHNLGAERAAQLLDGLWVPGASRGLQG